MIRKAILLIAAGLSACADSSMPTPHADGEIVTRAVQHAQAQVDQRGRHGESGK